MPEEKYESFTQHEHVLKRPSTYIGSTSMNPETLFVANTDNKIMKKSLEYNPGLLKIFDEVLVNAVDHSVRSELVTEIKVDINVKDNSISVYNNGPGIPVYKNKIKNKEEEIELYIPQMIFGRLLTSSNYDDTKERVSAGVNGLGGKLANIFSKKFTVETVDSTRKLHYIQTFKDNMYVVDLPEITKYTKKPFTRVTFHPDLARFKLTKITDDMFNLMKRRVFDAAALTDKRVKIYFNGDHLEVKEFVDYTRLYFGSIDSRKPDAYQKIEFGSYLWEIAAYRNDHFEQVSFVNGVCTFGGGKHVECVLKQISKKLSELITQKKKGIENLKPKYIEDHLFLFVKATVNQPEFTSQTKEILKTPISKFFLNPKEKIEVSEDFIKKLYKSGIADDAVQMTNFKNQKEIVKTTDGTKRNQIYGIPKLEDALLAGTRRSNECSLILTEGDSANAFAKIGRSVLGNDKIGAFPLRGKLLNVRDATVSQLLNNTEINDIKKILGLKEKEVYTNTQGLRYGKVILLTDADHDGSHIRNLFINFIDAKWFNLLKLNFIQNMKTPILVAQKGSKTKEFFNEQDYLKEKDNLVGYKIKYFKGLGTWNKEKVKDLFKRFEDLKTQYYYKDEECHKSILLAFGKDKGSITKTISENSSTASTLKSSDQRKEWLSNYDKNQFIDYNQKRVCFADSINKELIHFSMHDNVRSIPNLCDGLKPSMRKVMYYMLKHNVTTDIKVAQLASFVAGGTAYHHGETSLHETIIGMAQDFTGSNNLNLLVPEGMFGSVDMGGSDAASPRYIETRLAEITKKIFIAEDTEVLNFLEDDGKPIEPEYFIPVIPMVLINGCDGIGTGYSTFVPRYNPKDLITNINRLLDDETPYKLKPWYRNFNGEIVQGPQKGQFVSKGKFTRTSSTRITITALPVGTWIFKYKCKLDSYVLDKIISGYVNNTKNPNKGVEFVVDFDSKDTLDRILGNPKEFQKLFALEKNINTSNMHLFDADCKLKKYETPNDILRDYIAKRIEVYKKRRVFWITQFKLELDVIEAKIRFITEYINGVIDINRKSKSFIIDLLTKRGYPTFEKYKDYEYLYDMPIISLSKERIAELEKQKNKKKESLMYYQNSTEKSLWKHELAELEGILR